MSKRPVAALKADTKPAAAAAPAPAVETAPVARPAAATIDAGQVKEILTQAKPIEALQQSEIWAREAGIKFNTWEVVPDAGTDVDQLARPEFWANVAQRMKPGDTLLVYPRDGAYYAELLVWDAGQNWAAVAPKFEPMIRPALASAPGLAIDFDVRRDPIDGYVAIRRSDGKKLKGGFSSAEDARRWFLDHQKALRH